MQKIPIELPEVYGIWPTSFWQTGVGYGILILSGVGILCASAFFVYYYTALSQRFPAPLLRRLMVLSGKKFKTNDEYYSAYSELTAVLKNYVKKLYPEIQQGSTDWQMFQYLSAKGVDKEVGERLYKLIEHAQAVKFAHQSVVEKNLKEDIAYATSFIEKTSKRVK